MASKLQMETSRSDEPGVHGKSVRIDPGASLTLLQADGAGRVVRVWMTMPLLGQGPLLQDVVVRAWWDGEPEPSIELPLGGLFGASFGRPRRLVSDRLVIDGGGYVCRFEMPFNDGARLEVKNEGRHPLRHLFFQISWLEEERDLSAPTLIKPGAPAEDGIEAWEELSEGDRLTIISETLPKIVFEDLGLTAKEAPPELFAPEQDMVEVMSLMDRLSTRVAADLANPVDWEDVMFVALTHE